MKNLNNKGFSAVEVLIRVLLVLVGAMALILLFGEKPVSAAETRLSYNGVMFTVGKATLEQCKDSFELIKSGRRAYDLIKDGESVAVLKFNKREVLKEIVFNADFFYGLLQKSNAPQYSHFTEELTEKGIVDENTLLTGSRTPEYSEMSIKRDGIKVSWNYELFIKNGKLEGTATSVLYHEGDWYIYIRF